MLPYLAVIATLSASTAAYIGYVEGIIKIKDGVFYKGYDVPPPFLQDPNAPNSNTAGWFSNGSWYWVGEQMTIEPDGTWYQQPLDPYLYEWNDMICGKQGTPGKSQLNVSTGEIVALSWNQGSLAGWGPVLTYMAPCNGDCQKVDPKTLKFFKIDQIGLVNGTFGSTLSFNGTWQVQIPSDIAPGPYVLRHEILDLSQNFGYAYQYAKPFVYCFNLQVAGQGTAQPFGVEPTRYYRSGDPAITYDVRPTPLPPYQIPGPTLYKNAKTVSQTSFAWPTSTASVY